MPGQIRPSRKAAKALYKIMQTPKEMQQKNEQVPNERRRKEWHIDSGFSSLNR